MRTPFHDPLIIPVEDGYLGLSTDLFVQGGQTRTSRDLLAWSEPFPLLRETPPSVLHHAGTRHFWAPELVRRGNIWRLYCCASRPGKTQSLIGLATSERPEGPYTYQGDVVVTQHQAGFAQPNAIDPCVIADREGRDWLIYGSFFGGIRILPLREDGFADAFDEGKLIAGGGHQAIEGAYVIYQKAQDRYALFTSWGNLACDYHIRVAYAHDLTGPYLDAQGFSMTDRDPNHHPGDKLCGGYNFDLPDLPGVMATGHNTVLIHPEGMHLVHHARPEGDHRRAFLQIRRLLTAEDGRLMAWPLPIEEGNLSDASAILPQKWKMVYLNRLNAGVVYGVTRTLAQMEAERHGNALTLHAFGQEWAGEVHTQGKWVVCSLISEGGEALWGVAEE